jgi:hypothetical protein
MEGLPKSGAQLQGAENGAAYACARGMDGEKKITTHAAANRTALLHLLLYDCSRSYCCPTVFFAIAIDIHTATLYFHHHPFYNIVPTATNITSTTTNHPILSSRPASRSTVVSTPEP